MKNDNKKNYGQVERNFHHDEAALSDEKRDASVENLFDNDQYNTDNDDMQYKEDDLNDVNHETNDYNRNENIPDEERAINDDGNVTSKQPNDFDDDFNQDSIDHLEKDGDLDNNTK
jgi:uncharacterized protein YeaC (DUF1315 family)